MFDSFVPSSGNTWDKSFNSSFTSECGNAEPADAITPGLAINNIPASGASGEVIDIPPPAPASDFSLILLDTPLQAQADNTTSRHETQAVDALTRQALPAAVVEGAISSAHSALAEFASGSDFTAKMNLAFGQHLDAGVGSDLARDWLTGDFSELPPVEIRAGAEINGANGAFAGATNTIYLSSEFVAGNAGSPEAIASVLLEEMGHYIDSRINTSDAAGDEGAIFAGAVQGKEFDAAELQALKAEDDTAIITLDGKVILIEQDNTLSAARAITVGPTSSSYSDFVGTTDTNDYYKFSLTGTNTLSLTLNGLTGNADVQLIRDANNNGVIDTGDVLQTSANTGTTAESISRSLSAGTYFARVYPGSGVNTNYSLSLRATPADSAGNTLAAARAITVGPTAGTYSDFVGTADTNDYYKFSLTGTNTLNLSLSGLSGNADVQLIRDANNNGVIDTGDVLQTSANTGTTAESISRSLSAGSYFARVYPASGVNTNYSLSLSAAPVYSIGSLSLNQTQTASLSTTDRANPTRTGSFSDDYRLSGFSAGQQVQLNMSSTAFDSYLQLVNESSGQVIQFDDDSGGNNNSRLTFTAQSGINYLVRATSYGSGSTGSYSLSAAPVQTQIPATNWKAEYFNNINLTGTPVFVEDLGSGSQNFSRNWGNGAPTNTPSDNFSARMTTQRYLAPGLYQIQAQADDGVRVRVGNQTVIDKWVDQPFVSNYGYFQSSGVDVPVTVEYYERGGGAAINFNITPLQIPATNWKAEYFNNISLTGTPVFVEDLGSGSQNFSRNWGNGAPPGTPSDNFSARMTTQRYLAPGLYQIQAQADDGVRVRVGNQTVIDKWVDQPFVKNSGYFRSNGGDVPVTVEYYERGGGAAINLSIAPAVKFQDSVNEQQWRATVYSWNSSQGSAPPTNFWEGDYNNPNTIGVINLGSNTRSDGKKGINANWGTGAPNGDSRLPSDNFAMRAYTWADFDGSPYKFRVRGDDGFQLLAKNHATGEWYNITAANQWTQAYGAHSEITYQLPAGRYDMHFHQYEAGGDAYLDLSWDKVASEQPILTTQDFSNWRNLPEYTTRNPFPSQGQNCTWYAHGRMMQLGYSEYALDSMWGNAGTWDNSAARGATVTSTPQVASIAVWEAGVGGAGSVGHVAVVERVNQDGSILISESNWSNMAYNTRTISRNSSYWPSEFITVPRA